MAKKENNNRRFPEGKRPRPDNTKHKREEATERQAAYDKLSIEEKVEKLGKQVAKKQREKLASALENRNRPIVKVAKDLSKPEEQEEHKHLKAKERRKQEQQ